MEVLLYYLFPIFFLLLLLSFNIQHPNTKIFLLLCFHYTFYVYSEGCSLQLQQQQQQQFKFDIDTNYIFLSFPIQDANREGSKFEHNFYCYLWQRNNCCIL